MSKRTPVEWTMPVCVQIPAHLSFEFRMLGPIKSIIVSVLKVFFLFIVILTLIIFNLICVLNVWHCHYWRLQISVENLMSFLRLRLRLKLRLWLLPEYIQLEIRNNLHIHSILILLLQLIFFICRDMSVEIQFFLTVGKRTLVFFTAVTEFFIPFA